MTTMITPGELDKLRAEVLKITTAPNDIRTRIVTPCAQTCTTSKCYFEPNGRPDCPLC